MSDSTTSVNYQYIQEAIDKGLNAVVFLVNGVSLKGKILNQDLDSIIMECTSEQSRSKQQLVFKDAVSTIST